MSEIHTPEGVPPVPQSIPLLQAQQLPNGSIQVHFSPAVTDHLQCMLSVASALQQMAMQALAQERDERKGGDGRRVLRAPPGVRIPRVD